MYTEPAKRPREQIFAFTHTRLGALVLPVISGILLSLTLPWVGMWPLAFIALVPYLYFSKRHSGETKSLLLGTLIFGVIYVTAIVFPLRSISGSWWTGPLTALGSGELVPAIYFGAGIFLVGLWGSLFLLPLSFAFLHKTHGLQGGILFALMWTLLEVLRSQAGLNGYSWGVLGYALIDIPYLHSAALLPGGVYVLSFLAVLGNMAILEQILAISVQPPDQSDRDSHVLLLKKLPVTVVWVTLAAFLPLFGLFSNEKHACNTPLRVAVVSSDLTPFDSVQPQGFATYLSRIKEAISGGAMLILLPENVFPYFVLEAPTYSLVPRSNLTPFPDHEIVSSYEALSSLSREYPEVTIVVGLRTVDTGGRKNSMVFYKGGKVVSSYDKRKLVPFSEFPTFGLPIPIFEPLTSGKMTAPILLDGLRINAFICSEISDASLSDRHADIILSSSNDGVFSSSEFPKTEQIFSRARAIEAGAYLLRSSTGGTSSIIGPDGRVIAKGRGGILFADIPVRCK